MVINAPSPCVRAYHLAGQQARPGRFTNKSTIEVQTRRHGIFCSTEGVLWTVRAVVAFDWKAQSRERSHLRAEESYLRVTWVLYEVRRDPYEELK